MHRGLRRGARLIALAVSGTAVACHQAVSVPATSLVRLASERPVASRAWLARWGADLCRGTDRSAVPDPWQALATWGCATGVMLPALREDSDGTLSLEPGPRVVGNLVVGSLQSLERPSSTCGPPDSPASEALAFALRGGDVRLAVPSGRCWLEDSSGCSTWTSEGEPVALRVVEGPVVLGCANPLGQPPFAATPEVEVSPLLVLPRPESTQVGVFIGSEGGAMRSSSDPTCVGFFTSYPQLTLLLEAGRTVRVSAEAQFDSTLEVRDADGHCFCSDDAEDIHPALEVTGPGRFEVSVGMFEDGGGGGVATVRVREVEPTPEDGE